MQLFELIKRVNKLMNSLGAPPIDDYIINAKSFSYGGRGVPLVELVTSREVVDAIAEKYPPADPEWNIKGVNYTDYIRTGRFTFNESDRYYFTDVVVDGVYELMAFSPVDVHI